MWDMTSCNLVNVYVSEELVASIFRADDYVLDCMASYPRILPSQVNCKENGT
jgi:hypothetical protein